MENNHSFGDKVYVELDKLLLSPDAKIWVDNNGAEYITDEKLKNLNFQAKLLEEITSTNLISNLIANGFNSEEEIYVEEIKGSNLFKVVSESSNKIIAALKKLKQYLDNGQSIGKLQNNFFKEIPVVVKVSTSLFNQKLSFRFASSKDKDSVFSLSFSAEVKSLEKNTKSHFQNLKIQNYKAFQKSLKIDGFRTINIIAGDNNVGKTCFLEAIYLLANLNNTKGFFSICQTRGKFTNGINGETLERLMPNKFEIKGTFDNNNYEIELEKFNSKKMDLDRSNYRISYKLLAKAKKEKLTTTVNVFNTKQPEIFYKEQLQICPAVFSSPFSFLDKQLLEKYHDEAVEKGIFFDIINFINQNIDDNFLSINKVGRDNLIRFVVNHKQLGAIDLTEFGDGVQRIFYVAIMMASAENGVICIDEIENAIHHNLLVKFTKFIQKLAEKLNIQVFATTHSNECIKAFFENDYKNEDISGFRLINTNGEISYATASGKEFQTLLENFSLDLRG